MKKLIAISLVGLACHSYALHCPTQFVCNTGQGGTLDCMYDNEHVLLQPPFVRLDLPSLGHTYKLETTMPTYKLNGQYNLAQCLYDNGMRIAGNPLYPDILHSTGMWYQDTTNQTWRCDGAGCELTSKEPTPPKN